jgi:hypothetical protein
LSSGFWDKALLFNMDLMNQREFYIDCDEDVKKRGKKTYSLHVYDVIAKLVKIGWGGGDF